MVDTQDLKSCTRNRVCGFESLSRHQALVAQLDERHGSNVMVCGFESHRGYISEWCNGSTRDSESLSLGSNPNSEARR
jgi:hypothetical protein